MNQSRLLQIPGSPKDGNQIPQIMTVHRSQILEAHVFKNRRLQQEMLNSVFRPAGEKVNLFSSRNAVKRTPIPALHAQIFFTGANFGQMPGNTSHIFSDGHFVVIQNDHHGLLAVGRIIQTFVGHAAGNSTVTDQRNHLIILVKHGSGSCHTQSNGDRTGSMASYKCIGITFTRLGKAGKAIKLPQRTKGISPSGKQLVDIGLVSHIKNKTVLCRIINGFQGHRQLHNSQVGSQMTACVGDILHQKIADFSAKLPVLLGGEPQKIGAGMDLFEHEKPPVKSGAATGPDTWVKI